MAQYARITGILAPSQAAPGDLVDVQVTVQNLYSDVISIRIGSIPEYDYSLAFPADWANIAPGGINIFYGSFIMPNRTVNLHAYSYWYGADGNWYQDDEMTKVVNLAVLTSQISGFQIADYSKV